MRAWERRTRAAAAARQRKGRRESMKQQWRDRQAIRLVTARAQLHRLVGAPEDYPTHAAYMAAVNRAVEAKREEEDEARLQDPAVTS